MSRESAQRPSPPWLPWLLGTALYLITFAVFHAVMSFDFVQWDDDLNIYQNPHIRGLTPDNLYWMFSDIAYARRYMPLGWLSFAVTHQFAGLNASWFHAGNLILHGANAVLVLVLLRRLLARLSAHENVVWIASALGALVWAIHPLRVESVAWASSRIYNQALLFGLTSVLLYWRFASAPPAERRHSLLWISVLCYTASLLTYPITLCIGLVPFILDVFPLKRFRREPGWWNESNRSILVEKLPYAGALALVLGITLWARIHAAGIFEPPVTLAQFGLLPRAMQAFYIWGHYLWKTLVPIDLAPIYKTLIEFNPLGKRFVLSAVAVPALTMLLFSNRRRWPGLLTLWITYLIFLVPLLGLTEYPHFPSDRYSYLTGIILSIALAAGLVQLAARERGAGLPPAQPGQPISLSPPPWMFRSALAFVLLATTAFAALTMRQVHIWQNTETLMRRMIPQMGEMSAAGPIQWRLGITLMAQGRNKEAMAAFQNAVRLMPWMPQFHASLAAALTVEGQLEEAVIHYREALRLKAESPEVLNNLAWLLATSPDDKIRDGAEAVLLAERACELTQNRDATLLGTLAAAYAEAGQFPEAILTGERARAMAMAAGQRELATKQEDLLKLYRAHKPARGPK